MKNFFSIIVPVLLFCNTLAAQQPQPQQPTTILQQITNYHQNLSFNVDVSQETKQKIVELRETVSNIVAKPFTFSGQCYDWVMNNKLLFTFYVICGAYAYLHYRLFCIYYRLQDSENWSLWNPQMSMEELFNIPQQSLAESLLSEMQRRYTSIDMPDDFMGPIIGFLHALEEERSFLRSYERICKWVTTLSIAKIVWFDEQLYACCQTRLQKLAYLKSVFMHWIAEYKINMNLSAAAPMQAKKYARA